MATIDVLDSFINYIDTDPGRAGIPVVFLHGNPTSSYLWRNVIPQVSGETRVLAPDLIGMGGSGKPESDYRFVDHARYLDAWFDALGLDQVVLVGHDWGGALGMGWAARHPGRVRGIAVVETFLRPLHWSDLPPQGEQLFRRFWSPEGEKMVLEDNLFIEFNLPTAIPTLTAEAHDAYRAPYPTPESRKPMLAWPREFPIIGEPGETVAIVENYDRWMASTPGVPKLIMHVDQGVGLGSPEVVRWAAETFASAETVNIGPAGHHCPEEQPDAIGQAVADWARRHALLTTPAVA
ncbi:haloalkane dehalogenase [Nocardia sp. ET3-3]|uniref:Haloalkane dehalogenase n=2 Tax=Nocardia terrae TaxID=2675851 RepID=A0A7K1V0N1_9NOCA|nr:haloalkane dehalogenase [Nocardia terrae]